MELDIKLASNTGDDPHIFHPGNKIKGTAVVRLLERQPVKQVILELVGQEKLYVSNESLQSPPFVSEPMSWKQQRDNDKQFVSYPILHQVLLLWDKKATVTSKPSRRDNDGNIVRKRSNQHDLNHLVQGVLWLPFQFQLPPGLPPSLRCDNGDIIINYELILRVDMENCVKILKEETGDASFTTQHTCCSILLATSNSSIQQNKLLTSPYQQKITISSKERQKWYQKKAEKNIILKAGLPKVCFDEAPGLAIPVTIAIVNHSFKKINCITMKQIQQRNFNSQDLTKPTSTICGPALHIAMNEKIRCNEKRTLIGPICRNLPLAMSLGPTVEGKLFRFLNFIRIQVSLEGREDPIELDLPIIIIRGKESPPLQRLRVV
eukprot:jgi/Galph1/5804/GphlegSOOS_G4480.1